jgi:threonylcarbamoyladenosine tRNA methylthiotransferase MtaB
MGRKIKVAEYRRILDDLHKKRQGVSLGADLIVGFPGETERDFERMYDFLEMSPLAYLHVFSYSSRPGTPASGWTQVEERTKKERAARLRELSKRKNMHFRQGLIGEVWEGVVVKREGGIARVLTSNYVQVHVPSCPAKERDSVQVKITEARENITYGRIVD